MIEPVVRVFRDSNLAWLIAQVKASGVQTTEEGKQEPIEFASAWIELFEKKDGKWLRVGNVSNFKPASEWPFFDEAVLDAIPVDEQDEEWKESPL